MNKFHVLTLLAVVAAALINPYLVIPAFVAVFAIWWFTSQQHQVKVIRSHWPSGLKHHDAATQTGMLLQLPERNELIATTVVDLYLREPPLPVVVLCPVEGRTQLFEFIREEVSVEPRPVLSQLEAGTVTFCTTNEYRDLVDGPLYVVVAYAPDWVKDWLRPTEGGLLYYFDEEGA